MILPKRDNIIKLNRYHIDTTGGYFQGPENLLHPDSLEWVLSAIQYPLFSEQPYPTIVEKAAILVWTIINGHIFYDGNKRTGISTLKIFLNVNNYDIDATEDELIEVALSIASGSSINYTTRDFTSWIREKLILKV